MESLKIPITSTGKAQSDEYCIEVFPDEVLDVPSAQLLDVLNDESAAPSIWADAALLYMQRKKKTPDAANLLQVACKRPDLNRDDRLRLLASAGIAHLTQAQQTNSSASDGIGGGSTDPKSELRSMADARFLQADKVDTLFPMTWMGRGMLNLSMERYSQARFFFDTTLTKCGQVLPALLGMAAVLYAEKNYQAAQDMYAKAIRLHPETSGAATRVGFGLACYQLGQVDRAKAAFARALEIDHENVDAMVGAAVLDMASLDETSKAFSSQMEKAIKMMSMANLIDDSNAMVQNHLANHYFWKWTSVPGTVTMQEGSTLVQSSEPVSIEPGESIRIGTSFETQVADDVMPDEEEDATKFRMKTPWKTTDIKGIKVWRKDYDRVISLAKRACNSTSVQSIQAESLFFLARVHHVRGDYDAAHKLYERACKLSPSLSPARFGLAQTLITQDKFKQAAAHLQLILGTFNTATDALAAVGLLEVKGVTKYAEGLTYLRKAVDLDPLNPDLIVLESLALQQQDSNYPKALESYKKAIRLMERQNKSIDPEVFTNVGVLCHETKQYDECLQMYRRALEALDATGALQTATMENTGIEGGRVRHAENHMFWGYLDTGLELDYPADAGDDGVKECKIKDSQDKDASSLAVKAGDHIQIEAADNFESEVLEIKAASDGNGLSIVFGERFKITKGQDKENEGEETSAKASNDAPPKLKVKRENALLTNSKALTIAFNIARLHEIIGKTMAAVEIHKAIAKRNPVYVNSYLRLACIAIDCGALKECAGWLKLAAETAPGNPEVLTLIGNLHLSLCDWAPAQQVFDGLLAKKVPNVEAYAMLSLGNIYFANLKVSPKRYAKHLQYAADYYKRILTKDNSNAYAANGIGTVLAEKGELFKAKEVFNRVRQVSGDTIADAHLNLGHVYLAQKRHSEALQMYQSYMKRTEDGSAPISSKSRVDDLVDVLMYIAFAYFDWARQTELFDNPKAAPADERYQKAMHYLETALSKNTSKNVILTYNLCMTKLQAADCVLRKMSRNIRRTAQEVRDALDNLNESLATVENMIKGKQDKSMKVPIATSMLNDFVQNCRSNIDSAKSHLEDEISREVEANKERQMKQQIAEEQRQEKELKEALRKSESAKRQEERDRRAYAAMRKVDDLRAGWEQARAAEQAATEKKAKKNGPAPPIADRDPEEQEEFPDEAQNQDTAALFEDSDDDSDDDNGGANANGGDKAAASSGDGESNRNGNKESKDDDDEKKEETKQATQEDLFGDDSSDDSDEELVPSSQKRDISETSNGDDGESATKKARITGEDDD